MAFTYKIYTQGGMHVLGTLSDGTLIGERTFNPGRLVANTNGQYGIDLIDAITDKVVLALSDHRTIYKEDDTSWAGPANGNTKDNLNEFFAKAIYNLVDLKDIPEPSNDNTFLKYTSEGYSWVPMSAQAPGSYITSLIEDTSPQLGGNLDVNGHTIGVDATVVIDDNIKLTARTTAPTANAGGMYYNSSSNAFFVALES